MRKNTRGITLIALIITIIVLLILAGISISMITGEEGILQKVNEAKEEDEKARVTEELRLKIAEAITVLIGERKEELTIVNVAKYLQDKYKNTNIEMTIIYEFEKTADITITDSSNSDSDPISAIIQFEGWEFKLKDDLKIDENHTKKIGEPEKPEEPEEEILPTGLIELLDLEKVQKIKVVASYEDGIDEIKVLKGEDIIKTLTYTDNSTTKEEEIEIVTEFGKEEELTLSVNGKDALTTKITNMRYIRTAQDMKKFAELVKAGNTFEGKTVELLDVINLSTVCSETIGSWTPIGRWSIPFAGSFDGNGYSISNIYYNGNDQFSGLFGVNEGTISNLVISSSALNNTGNTSNTHIGALVGYNRSIVRNCIIENTVTVSITGNIATYAGGIAGVSYGYIADCVNHGAISGETTGNIYNMVGGIAAAIAKETSGITIDESLIGVIERSYNTGSVTIKSASTTEHNTTYLAGIAGQVRNGAIIRQCYNAGSVTASGNVSHPATGGIGGLIQTASIIEDCYNLGTITYTSTKNVNSRVGGITGSADANVIVRNCYNIGKTSSNSAGANRNGGVTGCVQMGGTINNCYALSGKGASAVYGQNISSTVTNSSMKTDTKIKSLVSTLGSTNWVADSTTNPINSGYPILKWQVPEPTEQ